MVKNVAGGCNGKKVARKHTSKGKNELRLSKSLDEIPLTHSNNLK